MTTDWNGLRSRYDGKLTVDFLLEFSGFVFAVLKAVLPDLGIDSLSTVNRRCGRQGSLLRVVIATIAMILPGMTIDEKEK